MMNKLLNDLKAVARDEEVIVSFQLHSILTAIIEGLGGMTNNFQRKAQNAARLLEKYENERGES